MSNEQTRTLGLHARMNDDLKGTHPALIVAGPLYGNQGTISNATSSQIETMLRPVTWWEQ